MIYTLGPEGTFSDKAASLLVRRIGEGRGRTFLPNIAAVFERAVREEGAIGVVPIENSVAGAVHVVQDLLARHEVWIAYEVHVPIAFKLLLAGETKRVRRLFVQPVAERQCAEALAQLVPGVPIVFTDSNTDSAVRLLSALDDGAAVVPLDYRPPPDVALKEVVLRTAAHNTTRFISIQRAAAHPRPDFSRQKWSMLVTPRENRPGVLHRLLGVFDRAQMNLTRIESRVAQGPWEYVFFLDVTISASAPRAWTELLQGPWDVRLLGCYSLITERGD